MNILSIETSCDETAVSVIHADGDFPRASYEILGDALYSQTDIHAEYGGVFPALAKREHAKTLVPLLLKALGELPRTDISDIDETELRKLLEREPELADALVKELPNIQKPNIDMIAVTSGPGLEPALWVGVNFAKALSLIWNVPVVPVDHMEGHILAALLREEVVGDRLKVADGEPTTTCNLQPVTFPALALLISGGHTELVLMKDWGSYEVVGNTLDDAVGEAFDKVARMLGLPYPGGPEISRLARDAREARVTPETNLPRPMLNSGDLNFSFSGLKTAVLYTLQAIENERALSDEKKKEVALDFENAVTEVLIKKTKSAIDEYGARAVILGGGVSANTFIRESFTKLIEDEYHDVALHLPERKLTTDNAVMIALSGHARMHEALSAADAEGIRSIRAIRADGTRSLSGG